MFYVELSHFAFITKNLRDLVIGSLWILSLVLTACDKPLPNPESIDPIYSDLSKQSDEATKELEAQKVELAKLESDILKFEIRDPEKKKAINQKYQRAKHIKGLEERSIYFKIRAEQRLAFDKTDYLKAYAAKKLWPDPEEYKEYITVKRLQSESRNWDDRVPKTTKYDKKGAIDEKKSTKAEKKE